MSRPPAMEGEGDSTRTGRRLAVLAALCLLLASAAEAPGAEPEPPRPNVVHAELLGNTVFGVNYERLLSRHASLRVGVGVPPINEGRVVVALVMPVLLLGSSRHRLEAGAGVLFVSDSTDQPYAVPTAVLGYRHRASGRWLYRVAVAVDVSDGRLWVMPGFGVGLSF